MKAKELDMKLLPVMRYIDYYLTHEDYTRADLYRDYYGADANFWLQKGSLDKFIGFKGAKLDDK